MIGMRRYLSVALGAAATGALSVASYGQPGVIKPESTINEFLDPGFGGTIQFDGWDELGRNNPQVQSAVPGFPSFPGFGLWPEAIESNLTQETFANPAISDPGTADDNPTGDATFDKTNANAFGYPAGISIYGSPFGTSGPYAVTDLTPVADLKTVLFQIRIGSGTGSGPGKFASWLDLLPTLSLNGIEIGTTNISGVISSDVENTGFGAVNVGVLAFQWDLSGTKLQEAGINGSVNDLVVDFGPSGTSSTILDLRLDQSNQFTLLTSVPEPASLVLVALGSVVMLGRRRLA